MAEKPTFLGRGVPKHVSSNGFVNYMGSYGSPMPTNRRQSALDQVREQFPDAIVVNGDDDWFANPMLRPGHFCRLLGVETLGYYHTGISGITKTGVVLSPESYEELLVKYQDKFGEDLTTVFRLDIYKPGDNA